MTSLARTFCVATLLGAVLLSMSTLAHAQTAQAGLGPVAEQEKSMWEFLKSGNYDGARAMLAPEYVGVTSQGFAAAGPSIEGMKACKLNSYSMGPAESRMLGKDA